MALTKVELAEALVAKGFDKAQAKDFVEQFFNEIRNALASGKEVKLSGFGNFQLREKKARPGRNPKTGEEVSSLLKLALKCENGSVHLKQKIK